MPSFYIDDAFSAYPVSIYASLVPSLISSTLGPNFFLDPSIRGAVTPILIRTTYSAVALQEDEEEQERKLSYPKALACELRRWLILTPLHNLVSCLGLEPERRVSPRWPSPSLRPLTPTIRAFENAMLELIAKVCQPGFLLTS